VEGKSSSQDRNPLVYKVFTAPQWAAFQAEGRFAGSPADVADGYVHLSTAEQLPGTLAKHYAGQTGLVWAAFEACALGEALRWEPSRGGALFPHLYAPLTRDALTAHGPAPLGEGNVPTPQGADAP
jgi:uncharacterized protein (DUF952 family)